MLDRKRPHPEADDLRQFAFAYWEAFNAYDADRVLGYLEEEDREQREEEIRGDIARVKLFNAHHVIQWTGRPPGEAATEGGIG